MRRGPLAHAGGACHWMTHWTSLEPSSSWDLASNAQFVSAAAAAAVVVLVAAAAAAVGVQC